MMLAPESCGLTHRASAAAPSWTFRNQRSSCRRRQQQALVRRPRDRALQHRL